MHHHDGRTRYRIIAQEQPFPDAISVEGTLEDLYLYYFKESSDAEEAVNR